VEYVYPAVFQANEDGSYTITYPDLPGCLSAGEFMRVYFAALPGVQRRVYLYGSIG
jgi:hypothetical protein